jgi:hypothetical protein
MSLPNTTTLDIVGRGLPSVYVFNLLTGPNIQTGTLDTVSRGLPIRGIRGASTAVTKTQVVWVG